MHPTTGDGGESPTVHQLLRQLAPKYLERFGAAMPLRHRQVLRKILSCRTPAMGGQLFACPDCPGFHYRYHSCNDRHCPQCGQTDADQWLQRQQARLLLPVPYFLVTFTVPAQLRLFIRSHQQITLDLLFAASAQALQDLAGHPRRLGAQLGMLGVLHTWSRTLIFHPHIHYLIPAGGLSPDGRRWVPARKNYLLHHEALGDHFRTVFKERLLNAHPKLSSFLQHILPRGFARVRTFGWLHPAAKVRGNRVRALLCTKPLLNAKEQQAWQPPADPKPQTQDVTELPPRGCAPLCPLCQRPMVLVGSWHAGQAPLRTKRPP